MCQRTICLKLYWHACIAFFRLTETHLVVTVGPRFRSKADGTAADKNKFMCARMWTEAGEQEHMEQSMGDNNHNFNGRCVHNQLIQTLWNDVRSGVISCLMIVSLFLWQHKGFYLSMICT